MNRYESCSNINNFVCFFFSIHSHFSHSLELQKWNKNVMQKREEVHENVRRIFGLPFSWNSLDRKPDEYNFTRYTYQNKRIFSDHDIPSCDLQWDFFSSSFFLFFPIRIKYRFDSSENVGKWKGKKNNKLKLLLTFLHWGFH